MPDENKAERDSLDSPASISATPIASGTQTRCRVISESLGGLLLATPQILAVAVRCRCGAVGVVVDSEQEEGQAAHVAINVILVDVCLHGRVRVLTCLALSVQDHRRNHGACLTAT